MKVSKDAFESLKFILKNYHNNNLSDFSRETKIDKSYISQILLDKRGIGTVFISKMNDYCDRKKIKRINFF